MVIEAEHCCKRFLRYVLLYIYKEKHFGNNAALFNATIKVHLQTRATETSENTNM